LSKPWLEAGEEEAELKRKPKKAIKGCGKV
jgi:hypothetical protein